ncbi:MAG: S1C family serine protease [Planctomycetota bacterium]|jgi:hypothetical protein
MKTTITTLIAVVLLLSGSTVVGAESQLTDGRPFMGVLIDPAPLPGLLSKHLGLPIGQGLRIQNVQKDSPADRAGLERDDLIIGFQGEDVHDYERLVAAIRQAGSGTEVSIQIIHLGARKTVKLTLKSFDGDPDWKYPSEPQAVQSWRPGRFFRLEPGEEDWKEMFKDGIDPDIDIDVRKFFNEVYSYHHSDGEDYTVTITGNPNDEDSTITVRIGDDKYTTTVKEIDKLPREYRRAATDALESARESSRKRNPWDRVQALPWRTPQDWGRYFDRLHPRNYAPFDRGEEMFDKIQEQMREMRKRLEELEKRHGEILDRFSRNRDDKKSDQKEESQDPQKAAPLAEADQKRI